MGRSKKVYVFKQREGGAVLLQKQQINKNHKIEFEGGYYINECGRGDQIRQGKKRAREQESKKARKTRTTISPRPI